MESSDVFRSLLPALVRVLESSQRQDGPVSKQALLSTTNEFKDTLATAKSTASNLPGGSMSTLDQDEIIEMLENLRDYKRDQLRVFLQKYQNDTSQNPGNQ